MFAKRLVAVRLRVRAWSKFDLSYLGRAHVEQQVLATSLYFHASFLLPSDALLAEIVSSLDRFVATGCLQEGPVGPLAHMPSRLRVAWSHCLGSLGDCSRLMYPSSAGTACQGGGYALASPSTLLEAIDAAGV